jgi:hypothetical protein
MSHLKTARTLAGALALSCITGAGSEAWAADGKSFPGVMCVQAFSVASEISYSGGGGAINDARGQRQWVCPVVRDIMGSDAQISRWDVSVKRDSLPRRASGTAHPAWDIHLSLRTETASSSASFHSMVTVPSSTGAMTLRGVGTLNFLARGFIHLSTQIPPGAEIISYHVEEDT